MFREVKACNSTRIGLVPSKLATTIEPAGLFSLSPRRTDDGFKISVIPSSFISNIPISFVEPNLFFTPLKILYEKYLSPSK